MTSKLETKPNKIEWLHCTHPFSNNSSHISSMNPQWLLEFLPIAMFLQFGFPTCSTHLVGLSIVVGCAASVSSLPMPAGPRALVRYFGRLHLTKASNWMILSREKNWTPSHVQYYPALLTWSYLVLIHGYMLIWHGVDPRIQLGIPKASIRWHP